MKTTVLMTSLAMEASLSAPVVTLYTGTAGGASSNSAFDESQKVGIEFVLADDWDPVRRALDHCGLNPAMNVGTSNFFKSSVLVHLRELVDTVDLAFEATRHAAARFRSNS
jgi:hypothetical protein